MTRLPGRRAIAAIAVSLTVVFAVAATAWGSVRGSDTTPSDTTTSAASHDAAHVNNAQSGRLDPDAFNQDMRKLWEDHVTWTRLYIVSAVANLPDVGPTAQRLLQNQDDIGDAIAAFYGAEAGDGLAALLRDHILIAADLIEAAKAGDGALVTAKAEAWYANGDDVAEFLAAANPAWPVDTMAAMMRGHLDQTLAEATARLNGQWEADIAKYDEIHLHILHMADVLADGIVEQFPRRFTH